MNAVWLVILFIFAVWGLAVLTLVIADTLVKRRHHDNLKTRDWTEKVDAMRRLHEMEGDA
jgi:hypothetical protein